MTAIEMTAAPTIVSHHHVVGTPTRTAMIPTCSSPRRQFCSVRSFGFLVFSRALEKWTLHTMIAWVRPPRATMWTMSQREDAKNGWMTAMIAAMISHVTTGRSRMNHVPRVLMNHYFLRWWRFWRGLARVRRGSTSRRRS